MNNLEYPIHLKLENGLNYGNIHNRCFQDIQLHSFDCTRSDLELYRCRSCDLQFDFRISLRLHFNEAHCTRRNAGTSTHPYKFQRDHTCINCSFVTFSMLQWLKHVRSTCSGTKIQSDVRQERNWFKCEKCPYRSKRQINLKTHYTVKHGLGGNLFKCDICNFETKYPGNLRKHQIVVHPEYSKDEKWFTCVQCPYKSTYKSYVNYHFSLKHSDENSRKWYKCERCPYKSVSSYNLKAHFTAKHSNDTIEHLFKCDKCEFNTKWRESLRKHKVAKHLDSEITNTHFLTLNNQPSEHSSPTNLKLFNCDKCHFITKWRGNIIKHKLARHTDEKDKTVLQCDKCVYKTHYRKNFRKHLLTKHSENHKWFKCEKCTFVTTNRCSFQRHFYVKHVDDQNKKWYECERCTYKTIRNSSLKRHFMAKHAEDGDKKWFRCEQCTYKTIFNTNLKKHFLGQHLKKDMDAT